MNFNIESFFIGLSVALVLRTIFDHWRNTKYINHDHMGAMMNWHLNFFLAWLPIVIIAFMGSVLPWWSGIIGLFISPILSFALHYPIDFFFIKTGLTDKNCP